MAEGYYAGIDVGSWSTKAVIIDGEKKIRGKHVRRTGADMKAAAAEALEKAMEQAGVERGQIMCTVSTGYGRTTTDLADSVKTEITCHGTGAYHHVPDAIIVVDIGGQDNKVIRIDKDGHRVSFKMNRKCAAGTGAFLEEQALKLDVPLEKLNDLARQSEKPFKLGSFCTVFTATEILKHLREGAKIEDIVRGLYLSITSRIAEMEPLTGTVVITGGVIEHNPVLKEIMEQELKIKVVVPPDPQFMGAFGAALLGMRSCD